MADSVSASQSYLFSTRIPYGSWAGVSTQPTSQSLPAGTVAASTATHLTTLTPREADSMLSQAIFIATSISNILRSIEDGVKLAGSSVTNPSASTLTPDATRISIGNIQAGVDQTLAGIDRLVARAGSGTANFLSSTSSDIAIQTSVYGGKINVQPQPFDVRGLGLENLNLHTADGRLDALARVGQARLTAGRRLQNLTALQNGLGDPSALNNAKFLSTATGVTRGVLVNLSA